MFRCCPGVWLQAQWMPHISAWGKKISLAVINTFLALTWTTWQHSLRVRLQFIQVACYLELQSLTWRYNAIWKTTPQSDTPWNTPHDFTFDPEASYNFIVDCEYVRIGSLFKTTSSYQIFYCCILKRSAFSLRWVRNWPARVRLSSLARKSGSYNALAGFFQFFFFMIWQMILFNPFMLRYHISYIYTLSILCTTRAVAAPPPLQIAATPYSPTFSWWSSVVRILEPELPRACPSEIAPPRGFTLAPSNPNI